MIKLITPDSRELAALRADPLLSEQELDFRPAAAEAIEAACGIRAGRVYWRSDHDHLYALELGDLGRGRPSTATVFGHWDRYEPRPPEHEIDADLLAFSLWLAELTWLDRATVAKVAGFAASAERTSWPAGAVLRTPEQRFAGLLGFDYPPRYVEIEGLRMAYVEQGEGDPILMLHGEPTWGYLYRKMIPGLSAAGRAIAPDLIGFGRSDKPVAANAYSYRSHARWVRKFIEQLDLRRITLVCQDWGGLLGLRVLSQTPERFARVVAMNTGISDGRIVGDKGPAFLQWRRFSQRVREMDVARLIRRTLVAPDRLSAQEAAAYNAPFPAVEYQRAVQVLPRLVPIREDDPGADENRRTIARLSELDLPVYLLWGAQDPITAPMARAMQQIFPQAGEAEFLEGAGHFIQEDAGEAAAQRILAWMETA